MDPKGDIPDRSAVEPPASLGAEAQAKVEFIEDAFNNGGSIHAYLISDAEGGEAHLYDYNTHVYADKGWLYFHGADKDKWIPGDDIGTCERHYE